MDHTVLQANYTMPACTQKLPELPSSTSTGYLTVAITITLVVVALKTNAISLGDVVVRT